MSCAENDLSVACVTFAPVSDPATPQLAKFRASGDVAAFGVSANDSAFLVPDPN